jgi:dTDP-4-dehydrorhamnose reductase
LTIISNVYGKKIDINKSSDYVIDRSLNSDKFRRETGFHPRPWLEMVKSMRDFK